MAHPTEPPRPIVPMTWRWSYFIKVMLYWFLPVIALWQFFNSKSCLCNSTCNFQWILVKPSSYCCHGLKRIILYQGHTWLLFTSYGPLSVLAIYQLKFLLDVFQVPISIRIDTLWVQLTYRVPPIIFNLCILVLHGLKLCVWFWGYPPIIFYLLFPLFWLSFFRSN